MFSSPNVTLIIARISAARFPRFAQNVMLFLCRFITKLHHARNTTPNKMAIKSALPSSCVKFSTLTPKVCYCYHLPLHLAITTAVMMATPVPEIMDTASDKLPEKVETEISWSLKNYCFL
jgi:hypothetical protein